MNMFSISHEEYSLTQEWLHEMFCCRNSLSQNDSYQHDIISRMIIMSIPPTWHQRDINSNIHGITWVSLQHGEKRISTKNMTISTSHIKNKTRSHIKRQTRIYTTQCIWSKETKKYMITLHILHIKELPKEEDDKMLDLVVPSISWHRISWKWLLTHRMLTPALHFEKWLKMEWSTGKFDYTIRFMALNNVKSIVKFLNSDKVKIWGIMKPAHKKIEKMDKRLQNKPLRGGNLLYITQMNNSWMIQMKRHPFYI